MNDERSGIPHPPYDELRNRLRDDPAAARALDELQRHLHAPDPQPSTVKRHVDALRRVRDLEAIVANWWDDPVTQRWVKAISDAGL
jgi:hypothetical protein